MPVTRLQKTLARLLITTLIVTPLPSHAIEAEVIERVQSPLTADSFSIQLVNAPDGSQQAKQHLAVVEFSNDTGETRFDNLKRGLAELLSTKLARRPELHLVERSQLDKAIKELGFSQSAFVDPSQAAKLGEMAGATVLLAGSIVKAGSQFAINMRLIDVTTGTVMLSESYGFQSEDDILPVANYLSLLVPQRLGYYVSDAELEIARTQLKGGVAAIASDNSWIYWAIGAGVLVVGALVVGGVMIARANAKAGPEVVIRNPRTNTNATANANPQDPMIFNLPLLNF